MRCLRSIWLSVIACLVLTQVAWAGHGQADNVESETDRPQIIGVFGDSLADGMWVGVTYHTRRDDRIASVERLSEVSTGLTNWVFKDVGVKTAQQLSQAQYDIAVVMFGANDMQGIRDNEGGIHPFRSDSWEAIYRERINILIDQFKDHGAQIYWVGLPTMRSQRYDGNVQFLNSMFRQEAEAAGITYIATREQSAIPDGRYSAFLQDSQGIDRLARVGDGVHFTLFGYRRIAVPVVEAIEYGLDHPDFQTHLAEVEDERMDIFEMTMEGDLWVCYRQDNREDDMAMTPIAPVN